MKDNIRKFLNKKNMLDCCFGALLLLNLVAIPVIFRKIISIMHGDINYVIPYSSVWYEQSKEARLFFEQQNINLLMACSIMAALLYGKHQKLAFLCLVIPALYLIAQRIF